MMGGLDELAEAGVDDSGGMDVCASADARSRFHDPPSLRRTRGKPLVFHLIPLLPLVIDRRLRYLEHVRSNSGGRVGGGGVGEDEVAVGVAVGHEDGVGVGDGKGQEQGQAGADGRTMFGTALGIDASSPGMRAHGDSGTGDGAQRVRRGKGQVWEGGVERGGSRNTGDGDGGRVSDGDWEDRDKVGDGDMRGNAALLATAPRRGSKGATTSGMVSGGGSRTSTRSGRRNLGGRGAEQEEQKHLRGRRVGIGGGGRGGREDEVEEEGGERTRNSGYSADVADVGGDDRRLALGREGGGRVGRRSGFEGDGWEGRTSHVGHVDAVGGPADGEFAGCGGGDGGDGDDDDQDLLEDMMTNRLRSWRYALCLYITQTVTC